MATSSFYKDFTLQSKKEVDSLAKSISSSTKSVKLDRNLTSYARVRQGELKLKQMLSR